MIPQPAIFINRPDCRRFFPVSVILHLQTTLQLAVNLLLFSAFLQHAECETWTAANPNGTLRVADAVATSVATSALGP